MLGGWYLFRALPVMRHACICLGMLLGSTRCHRTQAVGRISLTAAVHVFQSGLKRGGLKSPPPVLAQGGNQSGTPEHWLYDLATTRELLCGFVCAGFGLVQ